MQISLPIRLLTVTDLKVDTKRTNCYEGIEARTPEFSNQGHAGDKDPITWH